MGLSRDIVTALDISDYGKWGTLNRVGTSILISTRRFPLRRAYKGLKHEEPVGEN
jgi:hypothetical protein